MTDPDRDPVGDEPSAEPADSPGIARELAALEPMTPSAGLRSRIAADLASPPPTARPRGAAVGWTVERLAWAAAGAVAAAVAIGLPAREAGPPTGPLPPAPAALVTTAPASDEPRPAEEAVGWADEGVRFLDGGTPARVLRRFVVERHRAADGAAEVRVPREDVIFLPVALR